MRHSQYMKAILCFSLLFCAVRADEAADRTAIAKTVAALNEVPLRPELFTADKDARSVLDRLWTGKVLVVISHEPWGEAAINFPGGTEIQNPRIVGGGIKFVTPEVALADASFMYENDTATHTTPILLVLKKQGAAWKIASLQILAQR